MTWYYYDMLGGNSRIFEQGNLTFILTPTKITVQTPLQMFYLEPRTHYWKRRMNLIRAMIELQEIRDLNELASFCGHGNVEWIATNVPLAIEKPKRLAYI